MRLLVGSFSLLGFLKLVTRSSCQVEHQTLNSHPPIAQPNQFVQPLPISIKRNLKMKVVIIGAGIGGLVCAIACRREGLDAVVLERAPELQPVYSPSKTATYSRRQIRLTQS